MLPSIRDIREAWARVLAFVDSTPADDVDSSNSGTMPLLLSSTAVDLNDETATPQPLYACPESRKCIVTNIVMHKFSGEMSNGFSKVGWNDGIWNDVAQFTGGMSIVSSGLALLGDVYTGAGGNALFGAVNIGQYTQVLSLVVNTPEGNPLTARVDVFGYLTDTSGVPIPNVLVP